MYTDREREKEWEWEKVRKEIKIDRQINKEGKKQSDRNLPALIGHESQEQKKT